MEYAIIAVESVSKCSNCQIPLSFGYCAYCDKYGSKEKIITIVSTQPSYREILWDFDELDKTKKNIKYQIRRLAPIDSNEIEFKQGCQYAILETYSLLEGDYEDQNIVYGEILKYSETLLPLQNIHKNLVEGKIRITNHFNYKNSFRYLRNLKLVILSNKIQAFI